MQLAAIAGAQVQQPDRSAVLQLANRARLRASVGSTAAMLVGLIPFGLSTNDISSHSDRIPLVVALWIAGPAVTIAMYLGLDRDARAAARVFGTLSAMVRVRDAMQAHGYTLGQDQLADAWEVRSREALIEVVELGRRGANWKRIQGVVEMAILPFGKRSLRARLTQPVTQWAYVVLWLIISVPIAIVALVVVTVSGPAAAAS